MQVTPNNKKRVWAYNNRLWAMGLCGMLALGGCGGGGSDDEPVEEGRAFILEGSFLQGAFDPEKGEAHYLKTSVSPQARSGSTNLVRWNLDSGAPKNFKEGRDYRYENGRLYYRQKKTVWGATDPDGNAFFMMGPGQGLSIALRQPEEEDDVELTTADLEGEFSCLRTFASRSEIKDSSDRMQWLSMTFSPGSEAFDFTVLQDTEASPISSGVGTYKVEGDATLRIESDESVAMFTPGKREELVRAGGFLPDQQLLFALYMLAEQEPGLTEVLGDEKTANRDEVPAAAFLACLKHGNGFTLTDLNGHYWYGGTSLTGGRAYNPTFGYITADGTGVVHRKECQSREVLRQTTLNAQLETDGSLLLEAGEQRWRGILSTTGDIALVMTGDDGTHMGFQVWMKAPAAINGCPTK